MFNFEKLEVWRKAIEFADLVYELTRSFPVEERFGLTNQMRRASVAVSSNIAEGSSRSSKTDYSRFIEIAAGSLFEVISQAHVGLRQGYLKVGFSGNAFECGGTQPHAKWTEDLFGKRLRVTRLSTLNSQP
jgi:four helix bundle protein